VGEILKYSLSPCSLFDVKFFFVCRIAVNLMCMKPVICLKMIRIWIHRYWYGYLIFVNFFIGKV